MTPTRRTRSLSLSLALALVLTAGFAPSPALAQQPPPAEGAAAGEESGRSGDGYIGTAILAFLAIFLVCKSARRS
jgi:hypothetical protein